MRALTDLAVAWRGGRRATRTSPPLDLVTDVDLRLLLPDDHKRQAAPLRLPEFPFLVAVDRVQVRERRVEGSGCRQRWRRGGCGAFALALARLHLLILHLGLGGEVYLGVGGEVKRRRL